MIIYKSSTFQMIACLLKSSYLTMELSFVQKSNNVLSQFLKPSSKSTIYYPQEPSCYHFTICILQLNTSHGFFIKVETKSFIYQGYNSSECAFGGLAAYDYINGTHEELIHFCTTQDSSRQHRNVYSSSNTLILILYSYNYYLKLLKINLSASTTKCKKITIDK